MPTITLFDQALSGADRREIKPAISLTKTSSNEIEFYFDVAPGNYDAIIRFPTTDRTKTWCGSNGPLVVMAGKDRHLFVRAPRGGMVDWHFPAAISGTLPFPGVRVAVVLFDKPMSCGDGVRYYDPETYQIGPVSNVVQAAIDEGAYYVNFRAYGKQDRTVALQLSGALFTHATVLVTETPDTKPNLASSIRKDVTRAILDAAMATQDADKLVCVPGF